MILNANQARSNMPNEANKTTEEICAEINILAKEGYGSGLFRITNAQVKEFDLLGYLVCPINGNLHLIKWSNKK